MTQRYKITVEYDGTDLLGWQKQADGASAQEFLEKAIEAFCQEKAEVYGAGRTDAGVHALAQVAHFDLSREVDPFRLSEAANAHLRDMGAIWGTGCGTPSYTAASRFMVAAYQLGRNLS